MNSFGEHISPSGGQRLDADELVWFLAFPLVGAFYVMFNGANWIEIALTFGSGLLLSAIVGLRETWANRHPVKHELSHVKITVGVTAVMWSAFVIGLGLSGAARDQTDRQFGEHLVILGTLGQVTMVVLSILWGIGMRKMDWYPLRRTRASVTRVIVLYLLVLASVGILAAMLVNTPIWQWFLGLAGLLLGWLAIARLWRG